MRIFAQAPPSPPTATATPPAPPEGASAAPDLGGGIPPEMGGMPSGPGGGAPPIPPPPPAPISGPLDSLAKILSDDSLTTDMKNHFDKSPETTALRIWVDYGGSQDGRSSIHKGKRGDQPSPNPDQEIQATKDRKWERLPMGVGIDEITSTDAIATTIQDGFFDLSIQGRKQQSEQGGPTAKAIYWIKISQKTDEQRKFRLADEIDRLCLHILTVQ